MILTLREVVALNVIKNERIELYQMRPSVGEWSGGCVSKLFYEGCL
ncbi:hypothetical protein [Bradyrhizobium sp. DASA03120]